MHTDPKPLKQLIDDFIISKHWEDQLLIASLPSLWLSCIGDKVSSICTYQRFENGILYISVPKAPWRNELILRRSQYIAELNKLLGRTLIKDIVFR